MTTETIQPMSPTLTVPMVLFLFRQAQALERITPADRDAQVAEDAVVVDAGQVRVRVHRRAAAIGRFRITKNQKDRALARSFCLCHEQRS